jgi:hypothetical protein
MLKPKFIRGSDYAFDATTERMFEYSWGSSNVQSVGNILTVRNNTTNGVIYNGRTDSLLLKHVLPANTLKNGTLYNATIQVIDRNNNLSPASDPILFYCFTQPVIDITLTNEEVIQNSSCTVGIIYNQPEGEELQSFRIELYNGFRELIYTSSLKYDPSSTITLNNLEDNMAYYVQAVCDTVNHMTAESELIRINVDYIKPELYAYIFVENRINYGDIVFTSNLVSVEGRSDNPVFIDDEYVDTINGTPVIFDENFSLDNDYSLILKGYNFQKNKIIMILKNRNNTISLKCRIDENDEYYVEISSKTNNLINVFMSNHIACTSTTKLKIMARCVNHHFDIIIKEDDS